MLASIDLLSTLILLGMNRRGKPLRTGQGATAAHVRFGSKEDMCSAQADVR